MGLDKRQDIFPVQPQFRMGDQILGQGIDAGKSLVGIRGQDRQLPVKAAGKIQQDIAGIALQDIFVVQDPIRRRRGILFQTARHGEIRADPAYPAAGLFEAL